MTRPEQMPDELELLLCDLNGVPRGKQVAGGSWSDSRLPQFAEAILFQTITGSYAPAMDTYNANDGDLLLRPDWSTYRRVPWKPGSVGQVICDTLNRTGDLIDYAPRNVLKRILAAYEAAGLHPIIAPEVEFYLLRPVGQDDHELQTASGRAGAADYGGEAFSPDALGKYDDVLGDIQAMSEQTGLALAAVVHEMGPAQVELNVDHGEPLSRADQLFLLKRLIKGCAARHGLLASFMAKPIYGLPGNGLHLHCSVLNGQGENIFKLTRKRAPSALRHFIGGLQSFLPQAFALTAPNVNSYKRFVPDLSAPINLEWGYDNRTTGFRVPFSEPDAGRVENRIGGADANPYLLIAANLAAGFLGMSTKCEPTKPVAGNAHKLQNSFPRCLEQALCSLEKSEAIVDLLGAAFVELFTSVKQTELNHFNRSITRWEVGYLGSAL